MAFFLHDSLLGENATMYRHTLTSACLTQKIQRENTQTWRNSRRITAADLWSSEESKCFGAITVASEMNLTCFIDARKEEAEMTSTLSLRHDFVLVSRFAWDNSKCVCSCVEKVEPEWFRKSEFGPD